MTPLALARLHESDLKDCYKQYSLKGALVSQIMVGRVVTVSTLSAHSVPCEVTAIKLIDGKIQVHGKPQGKKKPALLCEGLANILIVEGAKP